MRVMHICNMVKIQQFCNQVLHFTILYVIICLWICRISTCFFSNRKHDGTICGVEAVMCILSTMMTGCKSDQSTSVITDPISTPAVVDLPEKGLTPDQIETINNLEDGYIKQLLNTPCQQVNMEFVDKMITDIFDSNSLAATTHEELFSQSDTVDVAGLIKFGHKPFYLHEDLQSDTVEIRWAADAAKAIGTDYERFYKISNNYTDASINVYYELCGEYLSDAYSLVLDTGESKLNVTNIEMIKTYIESRGSLNLTDISVYRLDSDGHEDLRIKYDFDTGLITTTAWEPDRINLMADDMPVDPAITDVRFTEISLPFMNYSKRSVVPANLPINGLTINYGRDDEGEYVGRVDFEFIANEEQAAQLVQFYAKHYPKAKLESNQITIDPDYTVTISSHDGIYKILVFCRDNFEQ